MCEGRGVRGGERSGREKKGEIVKLSMHKVHRANQRFIYNRRKE